MGRPLKGKSAEARANVGTQGNADVSAMLAEAKAEKAAAAEKVAALRKAADAEKAAAALEREAQQATDRKRLERLTLDIKSLRNEFGGYDMQAAALFIEVKQNDLYKLGGHKSWREYVESATGFTSGTVSLWMRVYERPLLRDAWGSTPQPVLKRILQADLSDAETEEVIKECAASGYKSAFAMLDELSGKSDKADPTPAERLSALVIERDRLVARIAVIDAEIKVLKDAAVKSAA